MDRPILLDYITHRVGESQKIFTYDYKRDVNVLINAPQKIFIECGRSERMMQTETRVSREADDNEYGLCELESKTEVYRERDDEEYRCSELETSCNNFLFGYRCNSFL